MPGRTGARLAEEIVGFLILLCLFWGHHDSQRAVAVHCQAYTFDHLIENHTGDISI